MPGLCVVLDTNVLVSGFMYPHGAPGRILTLWRNGNLNVVLSRYILNEVARVLPRLSRLRVEEAELRDFLDNLVLRVGAVEPYPKQFPELRDAADQQVLGTFVSARANYLITGDKDLLAVADRYAVLTPAQFLAKHL